MTIKAILYNGELYEDFDTGEYTEWEDNLDHIIGNTKAERDASEAWITYDFLISKGHFVSQPTDPRPVENVEESPKPIIPPNTPRSRQKREPQWTQSQMLRERERILKEKEKLFDNKRKAVKRRKAPNARPTRRPARVTQFYNADGTPYSTGNYMNVIMMLAIFGVFMIMCCMARR